MTVWIVYRVRNDDTTDNQLWSVYDNEMEALRECNCWNSDKGLYTFYCKGKDVLKVFEA
jgi:hypothetical protein